MPPSAPLLHVSSASSSSVTVHWKQNDDGGAPIRGYYLYYRKKDEEWESVKIGRLLTSYMIDGLKCGTSYEIYIQAYNTIGN